MEMQELESLHVEADGRAQQCRPLEPNKLRHNVGDFRLPWKKTKQSHIINEKVRVLYERMRFREMFYQSRLVRCEGPQRVKSSLSEAIDHQNPNLLPRLSFFAGSFPKF